MNGRANMKITDTNASQMSVGSRWRRLLVWVAILVLVWGVGLPWLQQVPEIDRHVTTLSEANINADAMFYTELEWESPAGAVWR